MKHTIRVLMHFYGDQTRARSPPRVPRRCPLAPRRSPRVVVRIAVVGTGLIGGSIGLALAELGHDVVGFDRDPETPRPRTGAGCGAIGRRRSRSGGERGGCRVRRVARRCDRRRGGTADRGGRAARHRRGLGEGARRRRGGSALRRARGPVHRRPSHGRLGAGWHRRRAGRPVRRRGLGRDADAGDGEPTRTPRSERCCAISRPRSSR